MYRSHPGSLPRQNAQPYDSPKLSAQFFRQAAVFNAWGFYRSQLMQEAHTLGHPVARHMWLVFPSDAHTAQCDTQFMVGSEILHAPVLQEGLSRVHVYLPQGSGTWVSAWNQSLTWTAGQGRTVEVDAPLGYPVALIRQNSNVGQQFAQNLKNISS